MRFYPPRDVASLNEQPELHVLGERLLTEVRARDQEALANGDGALRVRQARLPAPVPGRRSYGHE